jgi:hypothetical protein
LTLEPPLVVPDAIRPSTVAPNDRVLTERLIIAHDDVSHVTYPSVSVLVTKSDVPVCVIEKATGPPIWMMGHPGGVR